MIIQDQRRENQKVKVSFKRFHFIFEVLYRLLKRKRKKKKDSGQRTASSLQDRQENPLGDPVRRHPNLEHLA
jgi:hypothetical protein